MPTAYAAPPLSSAIAAGSDLPPVWPNAEADVRGLTLEPLNEAAPKAARQDYLLYELLVLVDAIRDGRVRERQLAEQELNQSWTNSSSLADAPPDMRTPMPQLTCEPGRCTSRSKAPLRRGSIDNGCTVQLQNTTDFMSFPPQYARILARSEELRFTMNSDVLTGALLRALATSKPAGSFLELGTGCGLGTCWILDGMSADSRLLSLDTDSGFQSIARAELGHDDRVSFQLGDAGAFLESSNASFDMIYADAWPGKYSTWMTLWRY